MEWARLNQQAVAAEDKQAEAFFFSRSGYTTSPSVSPLFWLGDQMPTWDDRDGMASALAGTLSSGLSGFALTHADLGGYTGVDLRLPYLGWAVMRHVRGRELLVRWQEMGAFAGAVYRSHEGLLPDAFHQPWSDQATLNHFSRFSRLFVALRPYRRSLMAAAAERGWPLARHPVLHYPRDSTLLADGQPTTAHGGGSAQRIRQFMLGPDLMVVPVLAPGEGTVRGYFPCGRWLYLWASEQSEAEDTVDACAGARGGAAADASSPAPATEGRWLTVPAPIGYPAVYARAAARATYDELRARMRAAGLLAPYLFQPWNATHSERRASSMRPRG